MAALLQVILPVFLVIGFGYWAVWRKYFPMSGVEGLMSFTQNFAIPCLLFNAISTIDLQTGYDRALIGSYYGAAFVVFWLGVFGARILFGRPWEDSIAIGFCGLFANSVLLGLPISERAYGPESLTTNFAIISLHAPFCYTLGITCMEITRAKGPARTWIPKVLRAVFRNALLIGIALGFAVNLSGLTMPLVVTDAITLMARAALPAALFGLGGILVQYRPEGDAGPIAMVVLLSLIGLPVLIYTMGTASGLSEPVLRSAVLTGAMAPGVNTYVFANMYGVAKRVAATSVLVATGLCVFTVWGWLAILG